MSGPLVFNPQPIPPTDNAFEDEVNARIAADAAEQAARIAADNAETTARTNADNAEITARTNADNALSSQIAAIPSAGLSNQRKAVAGTYTVVNGDNRFTIAAGGSAFYTLNFASPAGYAANFMVVVLNEDTARGKNIALSGAGNFILWPGQSVIVFNQANAWHPLPSFQRWKNAAAQFYVDPALGNDSNDGLGTGAGAFATIQGAYNVVRSIIDSQGGPPTINLAAGTHDVGAGVNINYPLVGSSQLFIQGPSSASVTVQCSVASGSCFAARDLGTLTLGGMLLNTTQNGCVMISATQGAVIDLGHNANVDFNAAPGGMHIYAATWASVNVLSGYAVNGGAGSHITAAYDAYINYGSFNVTGAASLSFTNYAVTRNGGIISAGGVPMTFSGFASVVGQKFAAVANGIIESSATVYPGNTAGTTATGGLYS
jgi:hypothetical protein